MHFWRFIEYWFLIPFWCKFFIWIDWAESFQYYDDGFVLSFVVSEIIPKFELSYFKSNFNVVSFTKWSSLSNMDWPLKKNYSKKGSKKGQKFRNFTYLEGIFNTAYVQRIIVFCNLLCQAKYSVHICFQYELVQLPLCQHAVVVSCFNLHSPI